MTKIYYCEMIVKDVDKAEERTGEDIKKIEKIVEDFVIGIMDDYGFSYESLEEQVKEIVRKEIGEFLEIENDEEYEEIKNPEFEPAIDKILTGILDDERICFFEAGLYTHNCFVETLNLDYVCGNEFSNPFEAIDARCREIYE